MRVLSAIVMLGLAGGAPASAAEAWQQEIATSLGKPGTEMPDGVYRVALPRTDLHVTLDGPGPAAAYVPQKVRSTRSCSSGAAA